MASTPEPRFEVDRSSPEAARFRRELRELRRDLALSQTHLATAIGTSQGMVSRWEQGRAFPPVNSIALIEHVLELEPNHLLKIVGLSIADDVRRDVIARHRQSPRGIREHDGRTVSPDQARHSGSAREDLARRLETALTKAGIELDSIPASLRSALLEQVATEVAVEMGAVVERPDTPGNGDILIRYADGSTFSTSLDFRSLQIAADQLAQRTYELRRVLKRTAVDDPEDRIMYIASALQTLGNRITELESTVAELATRDVVLRESVRALYQMVVGDDFGKQREFSRFVHPSTLSVRIEEERSAARGEHDAHQVRDDTTRSRP
jgi:DNA-binding transcriptional regulator YiaG